MEPVTIKLKTPIEHGGKTFDEITLKREIELGDVIEAERVESIMGRNAIAISRLSGVPLDAVHRLKASDFTKIMNDGAAHLGNSATAASGDISPA